MLRIFRFQINEPDNGKTISQFLQEQNYSHAAIVQLKKTHEGIRINGIWAHVRDILHTDDLLELYLEDPESSPNIEAVPMELDILYEDEDILVINKPAHMPVHPSLNHRDDALANGVMYHYKEQGISCVFRCITRLDRDTTGVVLIAKNIHAASLLSKATKEHRIEKQYLALCEGIVPESGVIEKPIARKEASVILRCIDYEHGDYAKTRYQSVDHFQKSTLSYSLVSLQLETGRTHQIRVHMASIGHPLLGDFLYNEKDRSMNRQALHCCTLRFDHPWTRQEMVFSVPLPPDMDNMVH